MTAGTNSKSAPSSLEISQLSGALEMGCLNLQIMLDSIIDSLDGLGSNLPEFGNTTDAVHGRFNEINCFATCAKRMVTEALENSLALADAARRGQQ